MQTYKVFLASSEELKDDREKFELHGLVKTGGGNFTGRDHITSGTPPKHHLGHATETDPAEAQEAR